MSAGRPCTIVFRRTGHNHYSLNALLGLLDETFAADAAPCAADAAPAGGGPVAAQTAGSLPELLRALGDASAAGRRPVAAWSFTTAGRRAAEAEMAAVRASLPEALRLAGGPHPSARPQETLAAGADHVFRGEAEASLPAFLRGLTAGAGAGEGVDGPLHEPLPLGDLDRCPPFAWRRGLFGPVELMRGCAHRCTFCGTPRLFPVRRERSVAGVLEHARRLRAAGKRRLFFIAPDVLSYGTRQGRVAGEHPVNEERLGALLEGVRALGLLPHLGDFPSEVSPAAAARHPQALRRLRRLASNRRMVLGAQSGSDRVLRLMRRPHTVEDNRAAAEAVLAAGFHVLIDLLFGLPGEGREGREETLAFARSFAAEPRAAFHLHCLLPLPGTPLEGARPEPLEPPVLRELAALVAAGRADGDYLAQMKEAGTGGAA